MYKEHLLTAELMTDSADNFQTSRPRRSDRFPPANGKEILDEQEGVLRSLSAGV